MKDRLDKFFYSQIKEHELVISKTKESIKDNFLNVVDICYQALKNKKKIIFLEMVEVHLMHSIFQLN